MLKVPEIKLTSKRKKVLERLERFIPEGYDGINGPLSLADQSPDGVSAEEGFFLKTDYGLNEFAVKNARRYNQLVIAHKWLNATVGFWKKDIEEGLILPQERESDPDMKELTKGIIWGKRLKYHWYRKGDFYNA